MIDIKEKNEVKKEIKKDKTEKKKLTRNLKKIYNTNQLSNNLLGTLGNFENPDEYTTATYRKILEYDETCKSGIKFISLAVIAKLGKYVHKKEAISDFINSNLERINLGEVVEDQLSALWAGFSVGEIIFNLESEELDDNNLKIKAVQVQAINPEYLEFEIETAGIRKNNIKCVRQTSGDRLGNLSGEGIKIPLEKLLIYTFDGKFGNPYGTSLLKPVYQLWYLKKNMWIFWPRTLEKYGSPTAIGTVGDSNSTIQDENGNEISNLDYMCNILESLQNSSGVAIDENSKIEFLTAARRLGGDFQEIIQYLNKMIYRALLLPSLVADNGEVGSYSLGKVHFELFEFMLEEIRKKVTKVIINSLIKNLIIWNFGEQKNEDYGEFQLETFSVKDAKIHSEIFYTAINTGILDPNRFEDLTYVRKILNLPGLSEKEFKEAQEKKLEEERKREEERKKLEEERRKEDDKKKLNEDGENRKKDKKDGEEKEEKESDDDKNEEKLKKKFSLNGIPTFFANLFK